MKKRKLYETFIQRMDAALDAGYHLEVCWYAYALLEDKLISMLRSTGGATVPSGTNKGKPIRMLGPKRVELLKRAKSDPVLREAIDFNIIQNWIDRRNDLMHAMADGSKSLKDLDKDAYLLAQDGVRVVRECASAAMRLKRNLKRMRKQPRQV